MLTNLIVIYSNLFINVVEDQKIEGKTGKA